jgi:L-ascorbate metabolism protein UlaG (beta-lactamase superfamily)
MNIFISGDTGYDTHFSQIAEKFPHIDLAVIENGQYGDEWKYLHLMPDELVKAIEELNPERILTVHHSKYALGKHRWKEPLENISSLAEKHSLNLLTPMMGEMVHLRDSSQKFSEWWENV